MVEVLICLFLSSMIVVVSAILLDENMQVYASSCKLTLLFQINILFSFPNYQFLDLCLFNKSYVEVPAGYARV